MNNNNSQQGSSLACSSKIMLFTFYSSFCVDALTRVNANCEKERAFIRVIMPEDKKNYCTRGMFVDLVKTFHGSCETNFTWTLASGFSIDTNFNYMKMWCLSTWIGGWKWGQKGYKMMVFWWSAIILNSSTCSGRKYPQGVREVFFWRILQPSLSASFLNIQPGCNMQFDQSIYDNYGKVFHNNNKVKEKYYGEKERDGKKIEKVFKTFDTQYDKVYCCYSVNGILYTSSSWVLHPTPPSPI